MDLNLNPAQNAVIEQVAKLARERFAPRAAYYDESACFPAEDFNDLFHAGLHAPVISKERGGLGLGPYREDVFTLWMMTKEIAKADLSMARCWEGHVNSLVLLDNLATEAQKDRWFEGVTGRGEKWVAWSGEPQAVAQGQTTRFGTYVQRVDGGYVVDGTKAFCTSAGGAQWAVLLVNTAGPGGARHSVGPAGQLLLAACDLSDPTVCFDPSWWNPIGMRSTVSHVARFDHTFIPDANLIGYPGQYLEEGWQTCFIPHYAASFLGAAEGALDYALTYVQSQNKTGDPYIQQHVAQASIEVETCYLWLRHVASLWEGGQYEKAKLGGAGPGF